MDMDGVSGDSNSLSLAIAANQDDLALINEKLTIACSDSTGTLIPPASRLAPESQHQRQTTLLLLAMEAGESAVVKLWTVYVPGAGSRRIRCSLKQGRHL
ncbi:hypothetical protein THIOSC15_990001 [uncultured Thiomicrorhabdus sp.]